MNDLEVFTAARQLADPEERSVYLAGACGDDLLLRKQVEALLKSDESASSFLESPAPVLVARLDPLNDAEVSSDSSASATGGLEFRTLGDFRILDEIGRGGMGVVYEAEQVSLGRRVALKVLSYASILDKTKLERFKIEARAAASLDHPNVVHVHSVGSQRGVHYYAMQFIEGQTVEEVIAAERRRRGLSNASGQPPVVRGSSTDAPTEGFCVGQSSAVPGPEAAKDTDIGEGITVTTVGGSQEKERIRSVVMLGIQAAEALEHAHQMGIVHRDIKPSNLLVNEKQHLWVADFGLAMIEAEGNLTATGSMIGTLRYMSPEQMRGDRHVLDHHTDIYSLGATLFEMLTLQAAFPESDATRLMQRIPLDEPASPRRLNPSIPRDLETIVLKAMAKDHEDRYATAADLAADLRHFLEDEPIQARPPGAIEQGRKWARKHRAIVTTAVGTLAVTVMIAGGFLWQERKETLGALGRETQQRKRAEDQEALALAAKAEARQQAEAAQAEFTRAEENLDLALAALDAIYLDAIGRDKLLGKPAAAPNENGGHVANERIPLTDLERELLQRGLTFYDRFARQNATSSRAAVQTAQAFYRVALLQGAIGDRDDAEASYRSSIERFKELSEAHPDQPSYVRQLAEAYSAMANVLPEWPEAKDVLDKSRQAYSRAIELEPKNTRHYLARGDISRRLFDPQALEDYRKALALDPDNLPAHLWSAYCLSYGPGAVRDAQQALEHAKRALEIAPDNPACHLRMAETLKQRYSRLSIGRGVGQPSVRVVDDPEQVLHHYARAIELAPEQARGYYERARFYVFTGDYPRALADVDRVLQINREDPSALSTRASVLVCLGRFDDAVSDLRKVLAAQPHNTIALGELSGACLAAGKWSEAVDACSRLLERNPSQSHIYMRRATAYGYLKDYSKALADLKQALTISPTDTTPLGCLPADLVNSAPDSFKIELLKLADETIKNHPEPAAAYPDRAVLYTNLGRYQEADADFLRATQLKPQSAITWHCWGEKLAARGRVGEAIERFTRAIELEPDTWIYHAWRAYSLVRLGQFAQAVEDFNRALEMNSTEYSLLSGRCTAYLLLGDQEKARTDYVALRSIGVTETGAVCERAVMSLALNDAAEYRAACKDILQRNIDPAPPHLVQLAGWACSLGPHGLDDYATALALAEKSVAAEPEDRQVLTTLGAVQMRAGQYEAALATIARASACAPNEAVSAAYIPYFQAMAEHHLQRPEDARRSLDRANTLADQELADTAHPPKGNRRLTLQLLRREAQTLIGGTKSVKEAETDQ